MIRVTDLTFAYGARTLFDKASFTVSDRYKVGLVGINGSGKTTLFRLLLGQELVADGNIEIAGKVGFVPQEVKYDQTMDESASVRDYLNSEIRFEDFELGKVLAGLELGGIDLSGHPKNLSGGQKTKLALARALLTAPDILLLDEPTNFMDVAGKKWLFAFLSRYPGSLLLISHDLKLMDNAVDKILYVNTQTKKIDEYAGNYTKFLQLKKEREDLFKRQVQTENKRITHLEEGLRKIARYTSKKGVKVRVRLQHKLAKMKENLPEIPPEIRKIRLVLPEPLPVSELPIRAVGLAKRYGAIKVFDGLDITIVRGDRIALLGPNGVGKSTLIKILTGNLKPDKGTVSYGTNLDIGYYSQEFETFDMEKTLLDTILDNVEMVTPQARSYLGRFNFMGEKVYQRVASLSGGEKTRLAIALITGKRHNLLILDEPTTYLDVLSQRIILEAVKAYRGTMLIVSHTEEFITELKPNKAFVMPANRITFWEDELVGKIGEV